MAGNCYQRAWITLKVRLEEEYNQQDGNYFPNSKRNGFPDNPNSFLWLQKLYGKHANRNDARNAIQPTAAKQIEQKSIAYLQNLQGKFNT